MNLKLINFISERISKNNKSFLGYAYLIAFVSVALGSMALLLSLSVLAGFEKELFETSVSFSSHISLKKFDRTPINNVESVISKLEKIEEVQKAYPVITRESLYRANNSVDGILLKGISDNYYGKYISKFSKISEKEFNSLNNNQIIISELLKNKLNLVKGKEIIIYALNSKSNREAPRVKKFEIAGFYSSGMAQFDESILLMKITTAQEFLKIDQNSASMIEIGLSNIIHVDKIAEEIDISLGYPFFTITIFDQFGHIFNWIEFQKEPIPIVLGIISIVAVLNIITALLIAVVEKTKSIGILKTLGIPNSILVKVFVFKGVKIAIYANLIAISVSLLFSYLQQNYSIISLNSEIYYLDALPITITAWHYVLVFVVSIFSAAVASYLPAKVTSSISPLKSIRF